MRLSQLIILFIIIGLFAPAASFSAEKSGSLCISLDDGYASWLDIARDLHGVGGVATAFVTPSWIQRGKISFDVVIALQNRYGWEIGTHTYGHLDAPAYEALYGTDAWAKDELQKSIAELARANISVGTMVFPYNKATETLRTAALRHVKGFRDPHGYPFAKDFMPRGAFPGKPVDIAHYVPVEKLFSLIDQASEERRTLFLYLHEVLPDEQFYEGIVKSHHGCELTSVTKVPELSAADLCLVPDMNENLAFAMKIQNIADKLVTVHNCMLRQSAKPGARFLIGPCWSMRQSDFRAMIDYAARKLRFLRVSESLPAKNAD